MPGAGKHTCHRNFCSWNSDLGCFSALISLHNLFFFFLSCTFGHTEESQTIPYSPSSVATLINKLSNREINKSIKKSDLKLKATIANFTYFWPWQVFAKWANKRLWEPGKCRCPPMHSHNKTGDLKYKKQSDLKAERWREFSTKS